MKKHRSSSDRSASDAHVVERQQICITVDPEPKTEVELVVVKQEPEWEESPRDCESETGSFSNEVTDTPNREPLPVGPSHPTHQVYIKIEPVVEVEVKREGEWDEEKSPRECGTEVKDTPLDPEPPPVWPSHPPLQVAAEADERLKTHEQSSRKPYFSCEICKKKFMKSNNLKAHIRIHTGEKPFACGTCEQKFTQSSHLKRHERTHTDEKPYVCEVCEKKFTQLVHLQAHERIHTGEKPYACEICKHKFTKKSHLKAHVRIHTGEKPYCCGICKKEFRNNGYVKIHERIHTGEKPHCCGVCEKKFTQLNDLKKHERIHTGEKPYCCGTCQRKFRRSGDLKRHEQIHKGK